uniref:Zinc finger protein 507-like n=1 Tax=Dermatophagoides pteronyssinus TaxID=6956 RepID=A0A6P6Y788_DERPT|nr:zinc finger protein 507-like [Dermatophagoides pteronyssinus]
MDEKNIEIDILKNIEFMIKCNNERLQCIENKQSNESAEEMKLLHTNLSILTRLKQNLDTQSSLQQSKSDPQPSTSASTKMPNIPNKRELSPESSNEGAKKSRTDSIPEKDANGLIAEKDDTDSIPEKDATDSIPERDANGFLNCNRCAYRTDNIKYFRFHLQDHRRIKVYPCTKCSAIFKNENSLIAHRITDHNRMK